MSGSGELLSGIGDHLSSSGGLLSGNGGLLSGSGELLSVGGGLLSVSGGLLSVSGGLSSSSDGLLSGSDELLSTSRGLSAYGEPPVSGQEEGCCSDEEGIYLIPLQNIANGAHYICEVCAYTARSKHHLYRHHESFHSPKRVVCHRSYCSKFFPTKFMMLAHLADCFIICPWDNCEKKFKYKKLFDSHQRAHINYVRRMT